MRPDQTTVQDLPPLDQPAMLAAMTRGVARALRDHRDHGVSIITWDVNTQQIVEIPAEQIPNWIDELPDEA